MLSDARTKCEKCKDLMDAFGDHGTVCKNGGASIARHDVVRDTVARIAEQSGFVVRKEVKNLLPDTERRPADVFVHNWFG